MRIARRTLDVVVEIIFVILGPHRALLRGVPRVAPRANGETLHRSEGDSPSGEVDHQAAVVRCFHHISLPPKRVEQGGEVCRRVLDVR